jgi:hypothetical protein
VCGDDVWELYDGSSDWTQANDLSKQHPDTLHELQRLFLIEATRHNVLPLDDRGFERVLPEVAGRPTLVGDKQTLLPGMALPGTEVELLDSVLRGQTLHNQGTVAGLRIAFHAHQGRRPVSR